MNVPGTKRDRTRNRLLVATQQLLRESSAGAIGIRDITQRAQMSHASFYNYFESVEELLDNLSLLFAFTHAQRLAEATTGRDDVGEIFSISTRQTLRFMAESPEYGHYIFDAGMRIDHFATGMRQSLRFDLQRGIDEKTFVIDNLDLMLSLITGSLLGIALGIYRGELTAEDIEPATAQLLRILGVPTERAQYLATEAFEPVPTPVLPLEWPISEPLGK